MGARHCSQESRCHPHIKLAREAGSTGLQQMQIITSIPTRIYNRSHGQPWSSKVPIANALSYGMVDGSCVRPIWLRTCPNVRRRTSGGWGEGVKGDDMGLMHDGM